MGEITPKKIAFEGPPSSGKTTVLNHYKRRFEDDDSLVFLDEAAREFFEKNTTKDRSVAVQREIQIFAATREEDAATSPNTKFIIADRSIVAPYVIANFYNDDEAEILHPSPESLQAYSHFLLFDPKGIIYEKDPHRRETPEERIEMYEAYRDFFEEAGIPFTEVSGSVEERIDTVEKVIFHKDLDT